MDMEEVITSMSKQSVAVFTLWVNTDGMSFSNNVSPFFKIIVDIKSYRRQFMSATSVVKLAV